MWHVYAHSIFLYYQEDAFPYTKSTVALKSYF